MLTHRALTDLCARGSGEGAVVVHVGRVGGQHFVGGGWELDRRVTFTDACNRPQPFDLRRVGSFRRATMNGQGKGAEGVGRGGELMWRGG